VRRLSRVLAAASIRGNPMVWLLVNAAVPWDLAATVRLSALKADLRIRVPTWLAAWYEVEALSSLADLAYLNPEYAFPAIAHRSGDGSPVLAAASLGHPLLPAATKVGNDFTLRSEGDIVLLTGSNMSGKSTFVKAVGVNLALAMAGGPVGADSLSCRPVRLFASVRVSDSVTDGVSFFYAEVRRLRALLDAAGAADGSVAPLLFLIDELFRGTNNRERLLGGRALVVELARRPATGLVATHDLELVTLADSVAGIRNLHFRDDVTEGRMTFDYLIRQGPCPTTNALRIMRMAGLPTPDD
jgi:DNA mismatch repair ATPase MutS